jgi:hypothetical protein
MKLPRPPFQYYNVAGKSALEYVTIANLFFPCRCGNGKLSEMVGDEGYEHLLQIPVAVEREYLKAAKKATYG